MPEALGRGPYNHLMTSAEETAAMELIVADDGSIPADQLESLGLVAGTHLRVVRTGHGELPTTLKGSLSDFPDLEWDDFQRASELARRDVGTA